MQKDGGCMKCLRINDGKGEFSLDGVNFSAIDNIGKEDVLQLLNIALNESQSFEMDRYTADSIANPAHKIIYSNLYEKFNQVLANKRQFNDDVNDLYKEAYDKYKHEGESEVR